MGTNNYKHLEFVKGENIPYIKGTRIEVGTLGIQFNTWGYKNLEELAKDRDLSIKVVQEAMDWYNKNKELVTVECARIRKLHKVKD